MTQDDVIDMAKQAGMFTHKEVQPEIQAFAKLVAAKERERIALIGDEHPSWTARMYAQEIRNMDEA